MSDDTKTHDDPAKMPTGRTQPRQSRALALHIDFSDQAENALLYLKADFVQTCYVGTDVALSFYQIDYQHAANSANLAKDTGEATNPLPVKTRLIPVARIVMGKENAKAMASELLTIVNLSDPRGI